MNYKYTTKKESKNFYDKDAVSKISIRDVLSDLYGISINRLGFFRMRKDDDTPSAKYYPKTNTYCDFGEGNRGGNVISLVCIMEQVEPYDAMERLSNRYGIQPLIASNGQGEKEILLSNSQYSSIGLYGDLATKNMSFDFEHYSIEQNMNLSNKYHMSMNELKEKNVWMYESIIRTKAIPYVEELSRILVQEMKSNFIFHNVMRVVEGFNCNQVPAHDVLEEQFQSTYKHIDNGIKILKIATKNFKVPYKPIEYTGSVDMYLKNISNIDLIEVSNIFRENPIWKDVFESQNKSFVDWNKIPMDLLDNIKEVNERNAWSVAKLIYDTASIYSIENVETIESISKKILSGINPDAVVKISEAARMCKDETKKEFCCYVCEKTTETIRECSINITNNQNRKTAR